MSKIQLVAEGINPQMFDDSQLPNDVHVIAFMRGTEKLFDAVRAYTMVDIFDVYYDKLKDDGEVLSIESGYGRIKPKLYGKIKEKD